MDPICCVLHYWVNSGLESLHLLPHGLQAGASVKQVDDRHIRARMRLPRGERRSQWKATQRARVTKDVHSWSEQSKYVSINGCLLQKLTVAERMWCEAPLLVVSLSFEYGITEKIRVITRLTTPHLNGSTNHPQWSGAPAVTMGRTNTDKRYQL